MDELKDTPKVFANRLIRQMIDHSFGEALLTEPNDYLAIRAAFRSLGGLWDQISLGSPSHLDILRQVITAWGQSPERQNTDQRLI